MRFITLCVFNLCCLMILSSSAHAKNNSRDIIQAMQTTGHILMLRHALAPGYGDPENIQIGDCNTQRNLNESGRIQSANIGRWLKANNIKPSAIYSSQWCRCMDTASLLNLGKVKELSSLNSFFQMPQNRESSLRNLKEFITKQTTNNNLIIMVTHSVTISAIAGKSVASGDGVLLKLNEAAPYEFVGTVSANISN